MNTKIHMKILDFHIICFSCSALYLIDIHCMLISKIEIIYAYITVIYNNKMCDNLGLKPVYTHRSAKFFI